MSSSESSQHAEDGGWLTTSYIDSAEVIRVYGEWVEPSEPVALSRYHRDHMHHGVYTEPGSTRVMDLKVFGQGTLLYFYFIKVGKYWKCQCSAIYCSQGPGITDGSSSH